MRDVFSTTSLSDNASGTVRKKFTRINPMAEDSVISNHDGGFFEDRINEEVEKMRNFRERQKVLAILNCSRIRE
jgi:hypothetical protein